MDKKESIVIMTNKTDVFDEEEWLAYVEENDLDKDLFTFQDFCYKFAEINFEEDFCMVCEASRNKFRNRGFLVIGSGQRWDGIRRNPPCYKPSFQEAVEYVIDRVKGYDSIEFVLNDGECVVGKGIHHDGTDTYDIRMVKQDVSVGFEDSGCDIEHDDSDDAFVTLMRDGRKTYEGRELLSILEGYDTRWTEPIPMYDPYEI